MDYHLKKARALYRDRERIALSALLAVAAIAFFIFYSSGIHVIPPLPDWIRALPEGWASSFAVVASFNTLGFLLSVALMLLAYGIWSWAFLPSPAVIYTMGVLRGVFGSKVQIKQSIGKRFRVFLNGGLYIDIACKIKEPDTGEWFLYRLVSSPMEGHDLINIALRNGMSFSEGHFSSWVSNDEFHHRIMLMAKAMSMAAPSLGI
ncbi:MAG: hypothetical protein ACFE8Z_04765 [Candidatus Hermodarchaeota archaeon]